MGQLTVKLTEMYWVHLMQLQLDTSSAIPTDGLMVMQRGLMMVMH